MIKCTCENTKYKHVFRAVWRYFYDYISLTCTGNTYKAKIAQRIFCERVNDIYNKIIRIYYSKGKDLKREYGKSMCQCTWCTVIFTLALFCALWFIAYNMEISLEKKITSMKMPELKRYLQDRGISVNNQLKPGLVAIAWAVESMKLFG